MKPVLILAPMRGLTDAIFRTVYARYFEGIDYAVAPFISMSQKELKNPKLLKDLLLKINTGMKVVPQILSKDPENFLPLAFALQQLGYDSVNWNIGCPYPMVVNKGKGAGMLPFPERIDAFLDRAVAMSPLKISVKLRIGQKKPDEILKIIPVLNRYPLSEIIIHPRTAAQMYDGTPDLAVFENCISLAAHPIVFNGDIDSLERYRYLSDTFPSVKRWMLGRGVVKNPCLPVEIISGEKVMNEEKMNLMYHFQERLLHEYCPVLRDPQQRIGKIKNLWNYMEDVFEDGYNVRKKIRKAESEDKILTAIKEIFHSAVPVK